MWSLPLSLWNIRTFTVHWTESSSIVSERFEKEVLNERWFSSRLSRELCSISYTWQSSVCQLSSFIVKTKCHLLPMSSINKKIAVRNSFSFIATVYIFLSFLFSLFFLWFRIFSLVFFVISPPFFFFFLPIHLFSWKDGSKPFSEIPGPRSIPFFGSQWLYMWPGPYSLEKLHIANQGLFYPVT